MSASLPKPSRRWNAWPVSIIAFFALAIAAAIAFIVFCNLHPTDLVSADYYEREVRYQAELERVERTRRLTEGVTVQYDAAARCIRIAVPASHVAGLAAGRIHLYRPSAAGLDRHLDLQPDARGHQTLDAGGLEPGLWKVRVSWTVQGQDYLLDEKIVITALIQSVAADVRRLSPMDLLRMEPRDVGCYFHESTLIMIATRDS